MYLITAPLIRLVLWHLLVEPDPTKETVFPLLLKISQFFAQ